MLRFCEGEVLDCLGDPKVVKCLPRKPGNREQNQPGKGNLFQSTKIKRIGDLKNTLTSDMEMQSL